MLDRYVARGVANAIDDVPPHPPRLLHRVRRHDDLVDRRLELRDRVANRGHGISLDDEPVREDLLAAQHRERLLEPAPGSGAPRGR